MDFMKSVDTWFLVISVVLLGGYFLWSVKGIFADFRTAINELKDLIKELFEHRNDHETRITALETRCDIMHGEEWSDRHPDRRRYLSDDRKD